MVITYLSKSKTEEIIGDYYELFMKKSLSSAMHLFLIKKNDKEDEFFS